MQVFQRLFQTFNPPLHVPRSRSRSTRPRRTSTSIAPRSCARYCASYPQRVASLRATPRATGHSGNKAQKPTVAGVWAADRPRQVVEAGFPNPTHRTGAGEIRFNRLIRGRRRDGPNSDLLRMSAFAPLSGVHGLERPQFPNSCCHNPARKRSPWKRWSRPSC
jgi:hypothetical protein